MYNIKNLVNLLRIVIQSCSFINSITLNTNIKLILFVLIIISTLYYNAQLAITPYLPQTDPISNLIMALGGIGSNIFNVKTNITLNTTPVIGTFTNPSGIGFGNQF